MRFVGSVGGSKVISLFDGIEIGEGDWVKPVNETVDITAKITGNGHVLVDIEGSMDEITDTDFTPLSLFTISLDATTPYDGKIIQFQKNVLRANLVYIEEGVTGVSVKLGQ